MTANAQELEATIRALLPEGKGLLAADESSGTIEKRFQSAGVESTEENRRAYREMLFTAPGASDYLSGVILFDETIRQQASDGTPFPQLLAKLGIVAGIKVDAGAKDMALSPGEKVTEGLDGLRERLVEYKKLGARFAKWRAVITIGEGLPTPACMNANAQALARYAALCQEAGIVPIVEPEVLMDGGHSLERCGEATGIALRATFTALEEQRVDLKRVLLKPNMVLSGADASPQADLETVARATINCLLASVPTDVPGILFLSGGQDDTPATARLNAMNAMAENRSWRLSFSFSRALQNKALETWKGVAANVPQAQKVFLKRARLNSLASSGRYDAAMEQPDTASSD